MSCLQNNYLHKFVGLALRGKCIW